MIRNLKAVALAAMALAGFAAIGAAGASAAEYHCDVGGGQSCAVTLSPDGTGKTAHHVFIVKKGALSAAVTCNSLSGSATIAKTATEATVTNLLYSGCNLVGIEAGVDTNGCDYLFKANGGAVSVVCPAGKTMKVTAGACTIEVGSQALTGITYTNINSKKEVTGSALVKNISGIAGAGCAAIIGFSGAFTEGEYTTGNTIAKAFKDEEVEGAQVSGWWE